MLHRVVWKILTKTKEELTASTITVMTTLKMEAVSFSETLISMYQNHTAQYPRE
jgi:hypothetical protein